MITTLHCNKLTLFQYESYFDLAASWCFPACFIPFSTIQHNQGSVCIEQLNSELKFDGISGLA